MSLSKPPKHWESGDPERAHALPSRYYYDEGVFRQEIEAIFYPAWHFAGHRSEVAEAGDFIKVDVFDQSVVVVRGADDVVRAFHNVCQHRGTRLIDERRGKIDQGIRCPYHAWTYQLDGKLHHAPRSELIRGFDSGAISLSPVQVEEFSTFLFINLDPNAKPLRDDVGGALDLLAQHFPDQADLELVGELDYEVNANWKIIVDNGIEGYHFKLSGPVHKDLADLIRFDEYELNPRGKYWYVMGPTDPDLAKAYGKTIGDSKYQD